MATFIESDLWGLQLASKKTYSQEVEMPFRVTMAALGPTVETNKRSSVFVRVEDTDFVLCSLTPGTCEQQQLNLVFVPGEKITFYTDGDNTIFLTGNFLALHDEELMEGGSYALGSDDSDYTDDEDEEYEEDEEIDSDEAGSDEEDESDADAKIKEIKDEKETKKDKKVKSVKLNVSSDEDENDDVEGESDSEDEDEEEDGFNSEDYDSEGDDDEEVDSEDDSEDDSEEEDSEEDEDESDMDSEEEEAILKEQAGKKRAAPGSVKADSVPNKKAAVADDADSKPVSKSSTPNLAKKDTASVKNDVKNTPSKQVTAAKKEIETPKAGEVKKTMDTPKKDASANASSTKPNEKKENVHPQIQKGNVATPNKHEEKKPQAATSQTATPNKAAEVKADRKVVDLGSGLVYEDIQVGKGPVVSKGQKVSILYKGTLSNGKVFDENFSSKQALPFIVGKKEVVEGLDRAVQGAHVGGTRKITIPAPLAYGNKKLDGIPPNSTLIFEIKVLSVSGKQQH